MDDATALAAVLSHGRRRVVHFNVTANPTSEWTGRQLVETFPWDSAPKHLLRYGDQIYGSAFRDAVKSLGIEGFWSAPHSPWQNPFVERIIGSIRRERTDHVIVLNERLLTEDFDYCHRTRTHLSLAKDAPETRSKEMPQTRKTRAVPQLGGLHHGYTRTAA